MRGVIDWIIGIPASTEINIVTSCNHTSDSGQILFHVSAILNQEYYINLHESLYTPLCSNYLIVLSPPVL